MYLPYDDVSDWLQSPELTVVQAVFLSLGLDPAYAQDSVETNLLDRPRGYEPRRQAIVSAIQLGQIKGTLVRRRAHDGDLRPIDEFDVHRSTVDTASLCAWLKQAAERHDVRINRTPDYLDPNDPKYSPLFAAAVRARAVVDVKPEGMTAKKALARYLDKHETGLSKEARRMVVKVVNWQREGGAPRTRGGRKPVTR